MQSLAGLHMSKKTQLGIVRFSGFTHERIAVHFKQQRAFFLRNAEYAKRLQVQLLAYRKTVGVERIRTQHLTLEYAV